MLDIKVYVDIDDFNNERKLLKRFISTVFRTTDLQTLYGIDFVFCALSSAQYRRLGNTLKDCIVSRRLDNKMIGWSFRVSPFLLYVYKIL